MEYDKSSQKSIYHQIIKFNGSTTLMEAMANCLEINKINLNFVQYDKNKEKGNRATSNVSIYISIEDILLLAHDILSGRIKALIDAEKKKGEKYPKAIWSELGGISATKLAKKGQSRPDGKSLSRVLKLQPASKANIDVVFCAESGAGEEDEKGLIKPTYGVHPENRIFVALKYDDLKKFALIIQMHIQAFITAKYANGTISEWKKISSEK